MIQTIKEYKSAHGLTWLALATRFHADNYQEAQEWSKRGMLILTHEGEEMLISVRRARSITTNTENK